MNIIAVTVEYLLAGMLLLWIFCAPFADDIALFLDSDGMLFVIGGVAYMVGVVVDRVAEHVLDPVGQYETLKKAKLLERSTPVPYHDPLPLERATRAVREQGEGALAWHDQLRGRLRLTRNALILGHWAIIAIWVFSIPAAQRTVWPLPLVVSAALCMQVLSANFLKIPRTDEFREEAGEFGKSYLPVRDGIDAYRKYLELRRNAHWCILVFTGPLSSLAVLLLQWQPWEHTVRGLGLVLLSLGLWAMSRLAWARIHKTFVGYMDTCAKHTKPS